MAESDFQTELLTSLHHAGYHVVVVPDEGKTNLQFGEQFRARKKPYDAVVGRVGLVCALEFKQIKRGISFPLTNIKDHQWEGLGEARRVGWQAMVPVNFRIRPSASERKSLGTDHMVVDRAYVFPIEWLQRNKRHAAITSLNLTMPELEQFRLKPDPQDPDRWSVESIEKIFETNQTKGYSLL